MDGLPEHVAVNRADWNENAESWIAPGERAWAAAQASWGIWGIPELELRLLPDDMSGMTAIELGCGTAYVSAWMSRRGATVVGIDVSERQLETARRLQGEHGIEFPVLHGNAESVPMPDASFDFAISEYGAALWADPFVWIPEAHRLLRPGGELVFLSNAPLSMVCSPLDGSLPITERLERPYFGLHRLDWREAADDPGGIEFHLTVSGWFKLLRDTGFEVIDYLELQAPNPGPEVKFYVSADWAHRYPAEHVWKVRKRGSES